MIGESQRDKKCISHRPCAEDRRQHDVAQKAGDARQQRKTPYSQNSVDHRLNGYRARFGRRRCSLAIAGGFWNSADQ
jgi:hypothetical protein